MLLDLDFKCRPVQELDMRRNERLLLIDDSKHWWRVQNNRSGWGKLAILRIIYLPSSVPFFTKAINPSGLSAITTELPNL